MKFYFITHCSDDVLSFVWLGHPYALEWSRLHNKWTNKISNLHVLLLKMSLTITLIIFTKIPTQSWFCSVNIKIQRVTKSFCGFSQINTTTLRKATVVYVITFRCLNVCINLKLYVLYHELITGVSKRKWNFCRYLLLKQHIYFYIWWYDVLVWQKDLTSKRALWEWFIDRL